MQARIQYAFKEWAAVCQALASAQQSVILRKGGIHEGRDGFRIDHAEFWLYPTEFHQEPSVLAEQGITHLEQARLQQPAMGSIAIQHYVTIDEVVEIRDESLLPRLAGLHVWSASTIQARFHYRNPLLFALLVRIYSLPQPVLLPESAHFAGCRSWVDLETELATDDLVPVLTAEEHSHHMADLRRALSGAVGS
ncbi:MAG: hypothetical protein JWP89_2298 [Schlesneria sp.]|nr:hypothetical protein [Schlesneria sp.]